MRTLITEFIKMADMTEEDDALLMGRLCAGDDLALNALMLRWKGPLLGFMRRYVADPEEALDLAQETFVRVYQARERFNPSMKFSTWLFAIAANLCKNHLRWVARHPKVSLDDSGAGESDSFLPRNDPADGGDHPDADLLRKERAEHVRRAIHQLPHEQKTALILYEYEGLPTAQIARVSGCSAKAVENRIARARQSLRKLLGKFLNQ
ncbi:sigma-70 family RNA polymerase sigma factor [Oscillatoria amoena NRMC-F 0135]|nr:sigma-70 family RNA polymerase sigma factor [Oscillatoria laete-virens]MDL5046238.1 sigma-70 family RNA polymerase sigma factor [Oscillatoria amoena NRMC-F 0135]MDL5053936.1 sigma-70 family RNA polymerase sigma factor [Oscillatoria laete-virens NRMC-F 0139]